MPGLIEVFMRSLDANEQGLSSSGEHCKIIRFSLEPRKMKISH